MIKAILFDIDGVLVDSVRANAQLYRDVLGHFGFHGPTDKEQAVNNHRAFIDNIRYFASVATEEQIQQMFDYGVSLRRDQGLLRLMDGVDETLARLQQTYSLGAVSSRLHLGIGSLLEHFGIAKCFPIQVGYEDTTEHKPHPAPLLFGAQQLNLKTADIVYVGDAATDIQAAKAAGMRMILFASKPLPGADATVNKFSDLPQAVDRLSGG